MYAIGGKVMNLILTILRKNKKSIIVVGTLSFITSCVSLVLPIVTKDLFDQGIINKNLKILLISAGILLFLNMFFYILEYAIQKIVVMIEQKSVMYVRKKVISDILAKPLSFFEKYDTEYLVTRINESSGITNIISSEFWKFIFSIVTMIIALIYLFKMNVFFGILSILVCCFYIVAILLPMLKIFKINNDVMDETAEYNKKLYNSLHGISELKQYNQGKHFSKKIIESVEKIAMLDAEQSNKINFNFNFLQASIAIINLIVSVIVAVFIIIDKATLGDYFLITQYVSLVTAPILLFQSFVIMSLLPFISGIRIEQLNSEENEEVLTGLSISNIQTISIENLCFKYDTKEVLNGINLSINKNDIVQIIGENGSGKSTLLKIIMGLYKPEKGRVLVNGKNLEEYSLKQYRDLIGVIPQKVFLFDSTVKENIRLGNTDLDDAEFEEKLVDFEKLGIIKNIELNKEVIDNGKNLSGGQIKMIALARVLLRKPEVLILDEATAFMDMALKESFWSVVRNIPDVAIIYISHIKDETIGATKEYHL